jgi:N-acetylglucosaminyl-diphospho-decaprenol L-rhamnosyltransferase
MTETAKDNSRPPAQLWTDAALHLVLFGLNILLVLAKTVYAVLKILPVTDRVVFISRQSNRPPSDFVSLAAALRARAGGPSTVILAQSIEPGFWKGVKYGGHFARQMYYLATSRYVVLDSYCIAVSTLNHRESLRVVQIWHALGAFKKFGLSAVNSSGYYRQQIAKLFRMHNGYDTVIVSSPAARAPYSEAMGLPLDKVEVSPLPRVDELTDPTWLATTRQHITDAYPDLLGSKVALWAPTLSVEKASEDDAVRLRQLRHALAGIGYQLVEIPHPLNADVVSEFKNRKLQFSTHQWLAASDVFITDQSSLLVDASVLDLQIFLYVDDLRLDEICDSSYLDGEIIRSLAFSDSAEIVRSILDGRNSRISTSLREMFVQIPTAQSCTERMTDIIVKEHLTFSSAKVSHPASLSRMEAEVGIVTVSYNSSHVLEKFLASCGEHRAAQEIIVVDNGSADIAETRRLCALYSANLIELPTNVGYGSAVNLGVSRLTPRITYVIMVNPDVTFTTGAIETLFSALQHNPQWGLVGPQTLNAEGALYPSARSFPNLLIGVGHALFGRVWTRNPWSRKYLADLSHLTKPTSVGWLSGACIGVRRSTFNQVQGFDEGFFMYFEDVDLGKRVIEAGFENHFIPGATIVHTGAHSTSQDSTHMVHVHHQSALRYVDKKYSSANERLLNIVLKIGIKTRAKFILWHISRVPLNNQN